MHIKLPILLSCALAITGSAASAQAPPSPASPPAQISPPAPGRATGCTPTQSTQQGNIVPQGSTGGQTSAPLSDNLAKSDGVLCPPAGVDPSMRAPTPETGNTPVIPPPGSPGGDPTVRPK